MRKINFFLRKRIRQRRARFFYLHRKFRKPSREQKFSRIIRGWAITVPAFLRKRENIIKNHLSSLLILVSIILVILLTILGFLVLSLVISGGLFEPDLQHSLVWKYPHVGMVSIPSEISFDKVYVPIGAVPVPPWIYNPERLDLALLETRNQKDSFVPYIVENALAILRNVEAHKGYTMRVSQPARLRGLLEQESNLLRDCFVVQRVHPTDVLVMPLEGRVLPSFLYRYISLDPLGLLRSDMEESHPLFLLYSYSQLLIFDESIFEGFMPLKIMTTNHNITPMNGATKRFGLLQEGE